ncbi:FlgB family protein [Pseudooceanicola algae]|uniref:Uncharacterized protein n=1 Tax=Pseudooceanicola algae TaxID=1537215 RepID=A0A418SB59_9RHOB|nr:FlgB family protein [Pseudooceanicola algae]QPM91293.1 hypothetical protein PSAL_025460 [Pseudooceanicola algae]
MFDKLQVFRMADAMARHASARQTIVAENMANADTPDFKARDIASFSETIDSTAPDFGLRSTRKAHLNEAQSALSKFAVREEDRPFTSPNGNSVSVEDQVMKSVEVKQQHDRAVAIYKSALNVMHTALGRR